MSKNVRIVRPDSQAVNLSVVGVDVRVLATKETANGLEITFQKGEEGTGPPPHCHAWDESFYVLQGVVTFTYEGQSTACHQGTLVHIPGGTIHEFSFASGGGEMLEITHSGQAIQAFSAIDAQPLKEKPDIEKVIQIASENGIEVQRS